MITLQHPDGWMLSQHLSGIIVGTIFHDDHLEARISDLPQRGETIAQHLRTVVVHDQDGNLRPFVRGNFFLSWRRHNVRGFVEKYFVKAAGRTFPEFQPYSISKSSSAIMVAGCFSLQSVWNVGFWTRIKLA